MTYDSVKAELAFKVQMTRGWHAARSRKGWKPQTHCASENDCLALRRWAVDKWFDDPITAILEADQWYRENVEKKP